MWGPGNVQCYIVNTNHMINLHEMMCFRGVRLLHWVQEMMNIEDAMALYSLLVRVWACRNTFTKGSCYCVRNREMNNATCLTHIPLNILHFLPRASFPKSVNQMCRHYLACILNHTNLPSLNTMEYLITLAGQTTVCNIWNNVHHKNTSQNQARTKQYRSLLYCGTSSP